MGDHRRDFESGPGLEQLSGTATGEGVRVIMPDTYGQAGKPRRPHHKSRTGCIQCKQRKVKVSEACVYFIQTDLVLGSISRPWACVGFGKALLYHGLKLAKSDFSQTSRPHERKYVSRDDAHYIPS